MKTTIILLLFLLGYINAFGQKNITYSKKIEVGYDLFLFRTLHVDPGPGWRGYNLDEEQNGFELNFINGVTAYDHFFAGAGAGYLNFEGIHGVSVFGNLEYWPLKKRISPIMVLKIGYDHIWNQYAGGHGNARVEFGLGVNYKINNKLNIYIQSGLLVALQSNLLPFKLGFRF